MCKLNRWFERNSKLLGSWASLLQIIVFPTVCITVLVGYFQLMESLIKPDLILTFSNPKDPMFCIANKSKTTAEKPSYGFGIFDLDSQPLEPVPIPWKETSYLNGDSTQGPYRLMRHYGKSGHRYFGFCSVSCKNSDRRRWYWIHFIYGSDDNAWFVELGKDEPKIWNHAALMSSPDRYIEANFPEHRRIPIK